MSAIANLGKLGGNAENIAIGAALLGVAALVVYVIVRGPAGIIKDAAKGAVRVADATVAGTVTGVSSAVGIPDTDAAKCAKAQAEGRTWDASFACPAGDFLKYVFSTPPGSSTYVETLANAPALY